MRRSRRPACTATARPQGHLDAALRSSSAAGEDPDILRRVDVRLPPGKALEGDTGWDVFSLQYAVDGPLGAVLSPDAMAGARARGAWGQGMQRRAA